MKKNDIKGLTTISVILFGLYLFSRIHNAIGTEGIIAICVTSIIGYFIYLSLDNKNNTSSSKISKQDIKYLKKQNFNYTDHGDFVRYQTDIEIKDIGLYLYLYVDVKNNKNIFKVKVHDLGAHEKHWEPQLSEEISEYEYNVLTRKWKNGLHPFDYKSPPKFINFLINAWQDTNGKLPARNKRKIPSKVKVSATAVSLPKYSTDVLKKYDKNVSVKGSGANEYTINIAKLVCTCPDFKKKRSSFLKETLEEYANIWQKK